MKPTKVFFCYYAPRTRWFALSCWSTENQLVLAWAAYTGYRTEAQFSCDNSNILCCAERQEIALLQIRQMHLFKMKFENKSFEKVHLPKFVGFLKSQYVYLPLSFPYSLCYQTKRENAQCAHQHLVWNEEMCDAKHNLPDCLMVTPFIKCLYV